ncbi:DUF3800 domain-containing protein [Vulcanisaeta distributa]|uniref:DUF3800 domain-containing protein n=1 Tax=Vulcanisaeta distributa TaxID=164451 RepID=UPI000A4EDF1E|nr:DUF3800 domain-containing protein [Vulcanisaeta distributa]
MCLMIFIDESGGKPNELGRGGPFVIASVAIDELSACDARNRVREFVGSVSRGGLGISISEIHASDLVGYSSEWRRKRVDISRRVQVFNDFAQLISGLNILLNIVVVRALGNVVVRNPGGVMRVAITNLVERVFMSKPWFPPNCSRATLIFDSQSPPRENSRVKMDVGYAIRKSRAKPTFKLSVVFRDSRDEPLIQVADYVAYVVRKVYMGGHTQYRSFNFQHAFQLLEGKIRRCPGKNTYMGCGLKEWVIK